MVASAASAMAVTAVLGTWLRQRRMIARLGLSQDDARRLVAVQLACHRKRREFRSLPAEEQLTLLRSALRETTR
jgi:hypothetical protein